MTVKADSKIFLGWIWMDEAGKPAGVLMVARDVARLRRAEAELRDSEERYRVLVRNVSNPIAAVDNNGLIGLEQRSRNNLRLQRR